jgi:hypothetical protein
MREYWRHISPINRRSSSQILSLFDLYLFLFPYSILTVFLLHSSTSQQKIDYIYESNQTLTSLDLYFSFIFIPPHSVLSVFLRHPSATSHPSQIILCRKRPHRLLYRGQAITLHVPFTLTPTVLSCFFFCSLRFIQKIFAPN